MTINVLIIRLHPEKVFLQLNVCDALLIKCGSLLIVCDALSNYGGSLSIVCDALLIKCGTLSIVCVSLSNYGWTLSIVCDALSIVCAPLSEMTKKNRHGIFQRNFISFAA